MSEAYNKIRIRRGLHHFLLGKVFSAVAGFGAMVLAVRCLSVVDFAHYSILIALVEYLTAISAVGMGHIVIRYVPELYMKGYAHSLRKLLNGTTTIRTVMLLFLVLLCYWLSSLIVPWIGMSGAVAAFQAFLVVALFRSTGHFLSQVLESTLHQGIVQVAFTVASIGRLAGMFYLYSRGNVELVEIIWVEAITDAASTIIMAVAVVFVASRSKSTDREVEDRNWISTNFRKICNFAYSGYAQHLAGLPFGSNTNRLVGGYFLSASAMANFGFALSLYEYLKRYLPAQLLVGLIRPVVIAKYSTSKDFSLASSICRNIFIINLAIIGAGFVCMLVAGPNLMHIISGGKYVDDATIVFIALLAALLLETNRLQLELLTQAVERYEILIASNLLLATSIIIGILMVEWLGAAAFPLGNAIGLVVANQTVNGRLRKLGYTHKHDWGAIFILIALIAFSVGLGMTLLEFGTNWYSALALSLIVYFSTSWLLYGSRVREFMSSLAAS